MLQPKVKTVQGMVNKTFEFMYPNVDYKTFGTGRTDAKVSANRFGFQLSIAAELPDNFIDSFNANLPSDIRALDFSEIPSNQNPLECISEKYYIYLFSFGGKAHPFSANMVYNEFGTLDIDIMKLGAKLFEGTHNFKKYCTKPSEQTKFLRTISFCEINRDSPYQANFFPDNLWCLHIKSQGFMRYQIRLIMGQLLALGRGDMTLEDITHSLNPLDNKPLRYNAVGSGLILKDIV
jgi:tRNA pseudouridine38-40 synthase